MWFGQLFPWCICAWLSTGLGVVVLYYAWFIPIIALSSSQQAKAAFQPSDFQLLGRAFVRRPFKPLPTLPLVEVRSYLVDHRGAVPVSPECLRGVVGVLLAGVLPYALVP